MRLRSGIFVIGAATLAIAATGCSGTNNATTTTSPPASTAPVAGRSGPPTSQPDQSPIPASTSQNTSTTEPGVPACASGQVDVTGEVMSPATGHRGVKLTFSLAAGASPCTLSGYPGVDAGAGGALIHADRTPRGFMGGLPQGSDTPPVVEVRSGHPATAVVEGVAFDASGNGCPLYTNLLVTPPNSTDTRTVTVTIDTCALQVHPVTAQS
ncbi:DUF4232 domain-containing protein [Nocardia sp. CDC160]|uniref:DUF4232 domain-containing protein n=1 Tax=Nocardia sp. CDC160 TaxID=3112166 RepID=UPI002DBE8367|nr:DUF4232 domain-containing protein [Nocardia sp. CDC160]MEC3917625.1 DUF4232 domain-containing protein [Nocardia sp. CDC160]